MAAHRRARGAAGRGGRRGSGGAAGADGGRWRPVASAVPVLPAPRLKLAGSEVSSAMFFTVTDDLLGSAR